MINLLVTRVIAPGQAMTTSAIYAALMRLLPGDPYAAQKAAGALGGAVNGGYLRRNGNTYTCI